MPSLTSQRCSSLCCCYTSKCPVWWLTRERHLPGYTEAQSQSVPFSSNQQKSSFAHAENFFCTFPCRCFARLQRETSRNFPATRFVEDLLYVFLFTFICTAAHFHLGCRQYFSFSHCFQHCENTGKNKSHQQISGG